MKITRKYIYVYVFSKMYQSLYRNKQQAALIIKLLRYPSLLTNNDDGKGSVQNEEDYEWRINVLTNARLIKPIIAHSSQRCTRYKSQLHLFIRVLMHISCIHGYIHIYQRWNRVKLSNYSK